MIFFRLALVASWAAAGTVALHAIAPERAIAQPPGVIAVAAPKPRPEPACRLFSFREAAQGVYVKDVRRFAHMDADGDGIACEELPSRGKADCPEGLTDKTWQACGMGVAPRLPPRR